MKKGLVVAFDFDGTIADSVEALTAIFNKFANQYGFKQIDKAEIAKLKSSSPWQIIRDLRTSWLSLFRLPSFIKKIEAELANEIGLIKPISGIKDVLNELNNKGYKMGIITSDTEENVKKFLEVNELKIFDFIYAGSFLRKDKLIKKFLNDMKVDPTGLIYIGDETRDIEAARNCGVKVIAVSWGFGSKAALAEHKPDFLLDQPTQLIKVLENLD